MRNQLKYFEYYEVKRDQIAAKILGTLVDTHEPRFGHARESYPRPLVCHVCQQSWYYDVECHEVVIGGIAESFRNRFALPLNNWSHQSTPPQVRTAWLLLNHPLLQAQVSRSTRLIKTVDSHLSLPL
jgi:hypothetical protein